MKITRYNLKYFLAASLAITLAAACSKMEDNYAEFLKGGEKIYTGKAEGLVALPGKNRVQLRWLLVSDPKITKAKIYWNSKQDSMIVPIQRTAGTQTIDVVIPNLAENTYGFQVYTFDAEGNRSIVSEAIGTSYGENYQGSISNRPMERAEYNSKDGNAKIFWYGVSGQAVVINVNYTDKTDAAKTLKIVKVPNPLNPALAETWTTTDVLANYKKGTSFSYRTGYIPDAGSIDTFYTAYTTITGDMVKSPILPPPVISIKAGSTLVRKIEKYRIGSEDQTHLVLTPGIKVSNLQTEVLTANEYAIAAKVYRPYDLTTPLSSNSLIYDGDVIVFYYPDEEIYKTEFKASVFGEFKFAFQNSNGLNTNVTFSASSAATSSGDILYTGGAQDPYLQTSTNASTVGGWVAIKTNVPAGKYRIDVVYKHGSRGDTEMYLGSIAPANKIGERLATKNASNPLYLQYFMNGTAATAGHKMSIKTMNTMPLPQGDNTFYFTVLGPSPYQIILSSVQLRFVE